MSRGGSRDPTLDCKVYIGDLPRDASEKDIERALSYYGPIRSVWVARNPPGFAFVEFEDTRDADDAVRGVDGTVLCGSRVRVEMSTGKVRPKPWMRRGPQKPRKSFDPNDKCFECGERGHYAYDCTKFRRGGHRRSYSRSRSRSPRRARSYSRSRSRSRGHRTRSRSYSRSPPRRDSRKRSYSRSPRRSYSPRHDARD